MTNYTPDQRQAVINKLEELLAVLPNMNGSDTWLLVKRVDNFKARIQRDLNQLRLQPLQPNKK